MMLAALALLAGNDAIGGQAASLGSDCIVERTHNSLVRDMDCFKRANQGVYEETLRKYTPGIPPDDSVCNVHQCNASSHELREQDPVAFKGHLEFFGKQGQEDPGIDEAQGCIPAEKFLTDYVHLHKPVVMRGCAFEMGDLPNKWTDEYFRSDPDILSWTPIVETQKTISRNDRGPHIFNMTFGEFLDRYQTDPYYVINGIGPEKLKRDFKMPESLKCSRTLRQLDDFHMWFSSGGTESSQHFDTHDNLLGMIDGSKQVLLTDPIHSLGLYMDYHDKFGLSPINVRHIDLTVYPLVKEIPIMEVTIHKGDVLYIPTHWWHQVNSFKNDTRNMALSMGWHSLFPVGEVDDNIGFKATGLKAFRDVPSSGGLFALELIDWSKKIRNVSSIKNMPKEEICGGVVDDVTLADVPVLEDQHWHMYGMQHWDFQTGEEFFSMFLMPMARKIEYAIEEGYQDKFKFYREICDVRVTWAFRKRAYVTDFTGEGPPTVTQHSLDEELLLEYDLIVFVKNDTKFLEFLNMEWPAKEGLQYAMVADKSLKVAIRKGFNREQRHNGPATAFNAFHRCVSQLGRVASHAEYLTRDNPMPRYYKTSSGTKDDSIKPQTCTTPETCKQGTGPYPTGQDPRSTFRKGNYFLNQKR